MVRVFLLRSLPSLSAVVTAVITGNAANATYLDSGNQCSPTNSSITKRSPPAIASGVLEAIGNTPLIEIRSLSAMLGRRIFAKAEHMNPGGSVKDRAALRIIDEFERQGLLVPRSRRQPNALPGVIVEATGGNTGIGLALVGE